MLRGYQGIVDTLVHHGADVDARDHRGATARVLASKRSVRAGTTVPFVCIFAFVCVCVCIFAFVCVCVCSVSVSVSVFVSVSVRLCVCQKGNNWPSLYEECL